MTLEIDWTTIDDLEDGELSVFLTEAYKEMRLGSSSGWVKTSLNWPVI